MALNKTRFEKRHRLKKTLTRPTMTRLDRRLNNDDDDDDDDDRDDDRDDDDDEEDKRLQGRIDSLTASFHHCW